MLFQQRGRYLVKDILKYLYRNECYSTTTSEPCLTDTHKLNDNMQENAWHSKVRILDANWDLDDKNYHQIHIDQRICCSKFFSFEECRDVNSQFPRMLPSASLFEDYVSELGISNEHHVIVYDNHENYGMYSSLRVWWMFRVFGHNNVTVLNGGLKQWIIDGFSTLSGEYQQQEILPRPKKKFKAQYRPSLVKDFESMTSNAIATSQQKQVIDARGRQRFTEAHIPCALSTPFPNMLDEHFMKMKPKGELAKYFTENNVNLDNEIIASCGSGITATILALGLHHVTGKSIPVYDGSWSEWKERASPDMIISDLVETAEK